MLGAFHHHNDLKQHNDCKICTLQSSLSHADTPVDTLYLNELTLYAEATRSTLAQLVANNTPFAFQARAPPKLS